MMKPIILACSLMLLVGSVGLNADTHHPSLTPQVSDCYEEWLADKEMCEEELEDCLDRCDNKHCASWYWTIHFWCDDDALEVCYQNCAYINSACLSRAAERLVSCLAAATTNK